MENIENYNCRLEVAETSLRILRQKTKQIIASKLDSRKLLLTDEMLHRDWRGLAEKANLEISAIRSSKTSSTEYCIHLWAEKGAVIKDFLDALVCIDRYDVIDDTLQLIYDDYEYATSSDVFGIRPVLPPQEDILSYSDSNALTTDDQKNLNDGGTLQYYNALVLFSDEDLDFVDEMVQKLEGEYNLKLCLRFRDLLGGLAFEYSALMRIIEERCSRVIVVLSPAFLQSNANKFLTQFAHALSIDQQRRIVIPCMYKPCQKPIEISFCHSLDYFRTNGYWDYWKKLRDSIVYAKPNQRWGNANSSGPVLREIMPPSSSPSAHHQAREASQDLRVVPKEEEVVGKKPGTSGDLFITLPQSPVEGDAKSCSSPQSKSPTNSTFSMTPLLPSVPSPDGPFRSMLKRVTRFKRKKKKESLLV